MKVEQRPLGTSVSTQLGGGTPLRSPLLDQPHPLSVLLFGKKPPKLVDRKKHPKLRKALKKLELVEEQIAEILGVPSGAFSVELCEGSNASVSRDGQVAVGVELLEEHQDDDDFLVALMGHELGHQPWTWPRGNMAKLTRAQLNQLYRDEEAKADRFAGKVLAMLGLGPDSICAFLLAQEKFEAAAPSDYYPAEVRARMIRESYRRWKRALRDAERLSPRLAQRARELR